MRILLSLLLLNLPAIMLRAQASDTLKLLKDVTVSYQATKLSPVTFKNLASKEFNTRSTGQEPSFLLAETPSVTVYSDAGSTQGYAYFRMRGIDQTRINITLDGVPLNEPEDQGAYFSNYPDIFNSLSSIQIQRGIGTSKNGTASYGGSIQLFSQNLYDSTKITLGSGYGSFNSLRGFAAYQSGIRNRKALYVRASQIYSDGYKYNSSNNSRSVFLSGGLFHDHSSWKMTLLAGQQANELAWLGVTDSSIVKDRRTNANQNERDRFKQYLLQVQNFWHPDNRSTVHTSIYASFLDGNYDVNPDSYSSVPGTNELYNYAFKSKLLGFYSNYRFARKALNWTAGIHGNTYDRQHTGSEKSLGKLYTNTGYKDELSVFNKMEFAFRRLLLFSDLQYRSTQFSYRGSVPLDKLQWSFFNPKAGLSYQVKNAAVFYYSIGRTGREPTRNDSFGGNDDLLADSLGQPQIFSKNAEFVVDQELGLRYQQESFTIDFNLYSMNFRNEIVLDGKLGPNGLNLTNNVEKSFRKGIELSLKYQIDQQISLVNNSSYNHSRIKEQREIFQPVLTPAVILNQEIIYSKKRLLLGVSGRYQGGSYIDFANTSKVKGYCVFNSRILYQVQKLELGLFAYNITNVRYFNNGYVDTDGTRKFFVQAPANFYASLNYSF